MNYSSDSQIIPIKHKGKDNFLMAAKYYHIVQIYVLIELYKVKPGYKNIGLCDTSYITSDILW
jgi:hypothetical protein